MVIKKRLSIDEVISEKYIKWLADLSKDSGPIVGGKGANLAEMYNSGFPVPPAFCVTAQAFDQYLKLAGIKEKIKEIIEKTNVDDTDELEKNAREIRSIIVSSNMSEDMEQEILEAYEILGAGDSSIKGSEISKDALRILKHSKEDIFVAVRSSATTEDLSTASFAGQQETFTNIKGAEELIHAIKKCFASLYTARAVYYRHKKGFDRVNALLSVVVQKMINADKSGVIFTRNPVSQQDEIVIEAVFGLGEGIVSGQIMPDQYLLSKDLELKSKKISVKRMAIVRESSGAQKEVPLTETKSHQQVLNNAEIVGLATLAIKIEDHYKKPQDIEFAVDSGSLYIVQTRPITTLHIRKKVEAAQGEVLLTGMGASPGVASGRVKLIVSMNDLAQIKKGDVLVTKMTNPDMVVAMQRCSAIVTDEGGATAHAAIVSREMGIPCVVGTETATKVLKEGMLITVDGTNGKIHEGAGTEGVGTGTGAVNGRKEVLPIVKGTRTKIKVMVDLPAFAERAAKSECDAVGLMRLEGIIASSGKHPMHFFKENKLNEYTQILEKGIYDIAKHFKEIWIRTSDIRSDEYRNIQGAPKELEINPMLGFHGIRFSLKYPAILEAELNAIKNVAEKHPDKKFGIMFPQIISESEMEAVYKLIREKYNKQNIIIGAMIETPAAVQIIRRICKYAKFISFGTNDLTQYTLAIDRGNTDVQYLYNEMHPSVLLQLKRVIYICKEYGVETSICGQAGSKKEMVKFLIRQGIDSLSVNADMAAEISKYVLELERTGGNNNNMQKKTKTANEARKDILPVDDTKHLEKKIKEKREEVAEDKKKKEEEFPDIEIGFDPFQQQ